MMDTGRLDDAIEQFESALSISRSLNSNVQIGLSIFNLANALDARGDDSKAAVLYLDSVDILDTLPGRGARLAITAREQLARIYIEQGELSKAEEFASEAVKKSKETDDSGKASSLETLAHVRESQERPSEAVVLYSKALALRKAAVSPGDELINCLIDLGYAYCDVDRYSDARSMMDEALDVSRQKYGRSHSTVARALSGLSYVYYKQGQYDRAYKLCTEATSIAEITLGPKDPDTLVIVLGFARIELARGNHSEAKSSLKKLIRTYEELYGPNDKRLLTVLELYEVTLSRLGLSSEAKAISRRAETIRSKFSQK